MNNSPSCPSYGHNTLCFATTKNSKKEILVRVEHAAPGGMFFCRTEETNQLCVFPMQNLTAVPQIPSRLRAYNFQSLAHFWAEALSQHPKAVQVTASGISCETLARKLRESRLAKNKYGWTSPLVNELRWKELNEHLEITPLETGHVQIGTAAAKETVDYAAVLAGQNQFFVQWKIPQELDAFCLSAKLFSPKPVFIIFNLTDEIITDFESRYDVGFTPRDDGKSWEVIF